MAAAKTKPKPKSKPTRKSKSSSSKKPALKVHARKPPAPAKPRKARASVRAEQPVAVDSRVRLGDVRIPSGKLAIFDIGLVGYLPMPALEPLIVEVDVPRDRPLAVVGTRVGRGRFTRCWDHIAVVLDDSDREDPSLHSKKLGELAVDFARIVCMDREALEHWVHEDSLDGQADFVFWGRDEAKLAHVLAAPRHADKTHGLLNLPLAVAEAKSDLATKYKAENKWLVTLEVRPHSHHHAVVTAARANPDGAGTLELAGSQLLMFFTTWGEGVFPVFLDLDPDDRPIQIRIQLAALE